MVAEVARQKAAKSALQRQLSLARRGRSMLHPFTGRSARFEAWQHYPANDVMDRTGHWQFYFHAHEAGDTRHELEHGHIHLFRRNPAGALVAFGWSVAGCAWFAFDLVCHQPVGNGGELEVRPPRH